MASEHRAGDVGSHVGEFRDRDEPEQKESALDADGAGVGVLGGEDENYASGEIEKDDDVGKACDVGSDREQGFDAANLVLQLQCEGSEDRDEDRQRVEPVGSVLSGEKITMQSTTVGERHEDAEAWETFHAGTAQHAEVLDGSNQHEKADQPEVGPGPAAGKDHRDRDPKKERAGGPSGEDKELRCGRGRLWCVHF